MLAWIFMVKFSFENLTSIGKRYPHWMGRVLLGFYICCIAFVRVYFSWDQYYWITWTQKIQQSGLGSVYTLQDCNYPPFVLYMLFFWGKSVEVLNWKLAESFGLFRAMVFMFDILTFSIFAKILSDLHLPRWPVLIFLANIGLLYNSLVWRQVDSIHTFWIILSLYFLISKKQVLASFIYLIALNTKIQSIVFLPIFLMGFIHGYQSLNIKIAPVRKRILLTIMKVILLGVVTQSILLLPFILSGTTEQAVQAVTRAVDYDPVISANAYNFWMMTVGWEKIAMSDAQTLYLISYKQWGLLLFGLISLLVMIPLFVNLFVLHEKMSDAKRKWELFSITSALVFGAFFLFNTQMHERYIHPAIVFSVLFALTSRSKWAYGWTVLWSILYLGNLENMIYAWPSLHTNSFFFNPDVISKSYVVSFIILLCLLYLNYLVFPIMIKRKNASAGSHEVN